MRPLPRPPAGLGADLQWRPEPKVSDEFRADFGPVKDLLSFGGKWRNHEIGCWHGPGTTIWRHENVTVRRGKLAFIATRKPGETRAFVSGIDADRRPKEYNLPLTRLGCISSIETIQPPV